MRDVCNMRTTHRWLAPLALLPLLAAAPPPGTPVVLAPQPGTALDRTARGLVAQDLAESVRARERPLVLVGMARLGAAADRPALFVQLQSPRQCGSAGCSTSVFAWTGGRYQKVLDGVAGHMAVAASRHAGMADLQAGTETYAWNGKAYADTVPAPAIDLRPRTRRRAR
jgi:hypothetical protein